MASLAGPAGRILLEVRRLVLVLAVALLGAAPAAARSVDPRLARVHTFAFAIGDGALRGDLRARYRAYDLVVLDGQEARAAQIRSLRRAGAVVLGYLDVGSIERGRPWYPAARPYRLDFWADWGEWYADTSRAGYWRLIARRVAPSMLAKGFDGLFLDNTDMIASHPRQAAGMCSLVAALGRLVHRHHRLLFAQNGEDVIGPILRYLDGWNREDVTGTYDFGRRRYVTQPPADTRVAQAALRRLRRAGLLVTATDYVAAGDVAGTGRAVRNACAAGAVPFVGDIGLRRIPATPAHCPFAY